MCCAVQCSAGAAVSDQQVASTSSSVYGDTTVGRRCRLPLASARTRAQARETVSEPGQSQLKTKSHVFPRKGLRMASKDELVRFLDERVFNPILKASPERYSGKKQDDLKYVQDRTKSEQERFHKYGSADEVLRMYKDDVHSENAREVNRKLEELGLPRLADVRDEFERKAA
jgi:hypothetical protein